MPMHRLVAGLLAAAALASAPGCQLGKPTGPGGGASTAALKGGGKANPAAAASKAPTGTGTRVVGKDGAILGKIRLTGQVKLLVTGIVSDNQGGVVSNQGGSLISNNGGAVIANNGGGLAGSVGSGSLGSGILGKIRYGLAQAAADRELRLADAEITLHDAAGRQLTDAAGKPITARTDQTGAYTLAADLPAEGLVLRIKLWQGGELTALVGKDGGDDRVVPIDTATSLGAAYVLDQFVQGDQGRLDKLPAAEAASLRAVLGGAQGLLDAAPAYRPDELIELVTKLRAQAPAVDRKLDDIKALLIGLPRLGAGRLATEVAMGGVGGLAVGRDGRLLIGERSSGRLRAVAPDGRVETIADGTFGQVKRNFLEMFAVGEGPDGRRYLGSRGSVWRLEADGTYKRFAGSGQGGFGASLVGAADQTAIEMRDFAIDPDGTVIIAEGGAGGRLIRVSSDGLLGQAPFETKGWLNAVAAGPDGTVFVVVCDDGDAHLGSLWRLPPGGKAVMVTDALGVDSFGDDVAAGPDGTAYVVERVPARVTAFGPDGARTAVLGTGAPAEAPRLSMPCAAAVAPDGTLYVGDRGSGVVHMRRNGRWSVAAGMSVGTSGDPRAGIAVNTPTGTVFDEEGRLLVAESDGHVIRRLEGGLLRPFAGTVGGFAGDGGPASQARISHPAGLARQGGATYFVDHGNGRLRRIAPDGTIATIAGGGEVTAFADDVSVAASDLNMGQASSLAVGPDGTVYVCLQGTVIRIDTAGVVSRLAGQGRGAAVGIGGGLAMLDKLQGTLAPGTAARQAPLIAPLGLAMGTKGELYVADAGRFEVLRIDDPAGASPTIRTFAGIGLSAGLAIFGTREAADRATMANGIPATEASVLVPIALATGADGSIYVSEFGTTRFPLATQAYSLELPIDPSGYPVDPRVRRIAPDGTIHTVAGPGSRYFNDPNAEDGLLILGGLAVAPDGRLAIADTGTNLVRILPAAGLLP